MNSKLFGFKTTFLIVGLLHILLSATMFIQGIIPTMSKFGIPDVVLNSPHYYDAMLYVFYHQLVNGFVLTIVALYAKELNLRVWLTRILTVLYCIYTYFDFRVSDSIFGNALYKGPESIVPPIFTLIFTLLIIQLNFRKAE